VQVLAGAYRDHIALAAAEVLEDALVDSAPPPPTLVGPTAEAG
jgi:hypothetical protein